MRKNSHRLDSHSIRRSKAPHCRRGNLRLAVLFFCFIELLSACSSKAKVQYESYERTAMQEKISSIDKDGESSSRYKILSAKLNETERRSLNTLLDIIVDKTPSKADKKATVDASLRALSAIAESASLRPRFETATKSLIAIARTLDISVKNVAETLIDAKEESKFSFLSRTETFTDTISNDSNLVALTESALAGFNSESMLAAAEAWTKIPAEIKHRTDFLKLLFKFAASTSSADLNSLASRAVDELIQAKIFQGMAPLTSSDANLATFVRLQNSLAAASLDEFTKLTSNYSEPALTGAVKTSLTEAIKKSLVLKESLRASFLADLSATIKSADSQTTLNAMIDSIDRTTGDAYFALPKFTSRYLKPTSEPVCQLKGASTAKVTYAFQWTVGGIPSADWSTPSAARQSSAGSTFAPNTEVLCSVRIFVDGSKVNELNTDLVTVRSSAPTFTSGDPPQEEIFAIKKGDPFVYIVAVRDNVTDPNTFYQMTTQPQHGVVTQTSLGTFEYKPVPAFIGSDQFSFTACNSDNICSSDKVVKLNIADGNQSPRLESLIAPAWNTVAGGIQMSRDSAITNIQLVINEDNVIDSSCGIPNVMVLSGDTGKFPQTTANIEVSGVFPYCKLKLSPAAGSAGLGTTTMTLKLDDQVNPQVLSTFTVTVVEKDPQWATHQQHPQRTA